MSLKNKLLCSHWSCWHIAELQATITLCKRCITILRRQYGRQIMCECHQSSLYFSVEALQDSRKDVSCANIQCGNRAANTLKMIVCGCHADVLQKTHHVYKNTEYVSYWEMNHSPCGEAWIPEGFIPENNTEEKTQLELLLERAARKNSSAHHTSI